MFKGSHISGAIEIIVQHSGNEKKGYNLPDSLSTSPFLHPAAEASSRNGKSRPTLVHLVRVCHCGQPSETKPISQPSEKNKG